MSRASERGPLNCREKWQRPRVSERPDRNGLHGFPFSAAVRRPCLYKQTPIIVRPGINGSADGIFNEPLESSPVFLRRGQSERGDLCSNMNGKIPIPPRRGNLFQTVKTGELQWSRHFRGNRFVGIRTIPLPGQERTSDHFHLENGISPSDRWSPLKYDILLAN